MYKPLAPIFMELRKTLKKYVVEKYLDLEFQNTDSYERNKSILKIKLLNELVSGDESRVLRAAKLVRSLDNLNFSESELEMIQKSASELPKSDICRMYDYRFDIKEGIDVIENFVNGNNCKCNIYEKYEGFSPASQIEMDLVALVGEPYVNQEKYQFEINLICKECGTKWFTFEQHSYHYPWSKWTKL
jgi:hypothetical protein